MGREPTSRSDENRNETENSTYRPSRRAMLSAGSAALATGMAGCLGGDDGGNGNGNGGNGNGNGGNGNGNGGNGNGGGGEPEKPDQITVRAWGGVWQESLAEHIGTPFTEETGIEVQYDNTDRTVMQGDIRTAIQQDREPPVNINWTVEPALHEEYLMDLADPLDPEIVTNAEEMFDRAVPDVDDGMPYLVLYSYTYALSYNEEAMESAHGSTDPPSAWVDFKDDQFENELGQYDNGYGFWPVLSEITDTPLDADDLQPIYDEIEAFEPSIGHIGDDTTLTQNIREGEIAGAPLIMNNLYQANQDGEPVEWTVPEEGATAWGDGMYTPRNQSESERYWSQMFINYAAAAENQEGWTEGLSLPMLNQNVEPLEYMVDDPAYPTSEEDFENLLTVDLDVYTEIKSDLYEEFNVIMGA